MAGDDARQPPDDDPTMDEIPEASASRQPALDLGQVILSTIDGRSWTWFSLSATADLERIRLGELALPAVPLPVLVSHGRIDSQQCSDDDWVTIASCLGRWLTPAELRAAGLSVVSVRITVCPNRHARVMRRRRVAEP